MNSELIYLLIPVFLVATLVTLLGTYVVKKMAHKYNIVDKPAPRKIHKEALPTIGGIAIYLGFILSVVAHLPMNNTLIAVIVGSTLILLTGLLDDLIGINAWSKLLLQICIATLTYYMGIRIEFLSNPFGTDVISMSFLSFPMTMLWIIGIMNTVNLIDGIDGLAAGSVAISAFFLTIVACLTGQMATAVITIAILGSALGFLKYNFPPAQIFMGDSGAMFLGYVLAIASIIGVLKTTITISLAIPILVLGLPISDTIYAIFRRVKNKKKLFLPDTEHIHHKLLKWGLTQKQAAFFLYSISVVLGILGLLMTVVTGFKAIIILIAIIVGITTILIISRRKVTAIFSFFQIFF